MNSRGRITSLVFLLGVLSAIAATACPYCTGPQKTLHEEFAEADAVERCE